MVSGQTATFPNSGSLTNGEAFAADGYPAGGWDSSGIIPAPRLGFAYQLTNDHKTVPRAGRGLFLLLLRQARPRILFSGPFVGCETDLKNPSATQPRVLTSGKQCREG